MHAILITADARIRARLMPILAARGYTVLLAADAEEAAAALGALFWPLLIVDARDPLGPGGEACRRLRALPQGEQCVISALGPPGDLPRLQALLAAGAHDYLAETPDDASLAERLTVAEHYRVLRREAEQAFQQDETKLRGLFDNLPDFILQVDRNAVIQFANRRIGSLGPEDMVGSFGLKFIVDEHRQWCLDALDTAIQTRQVQAIEVLSMQGRWWACRVVPLVEDGQAQTALILCTDITEQKHAAMAVEKEQQLLRQVIDVHERDRQLIAYEIHDGFAQQLTGALYQFQGFREQHGRDPARAWQSFDAALRLLCESINEARRLISGLRPPILDEMGVAAAVEYLLAESHSAAGPEVDFVNRTTFDRLAPPLESAIFRIIQETLANACRHSRSGRVRIELRQADGQVHIGVRDWGVGFDPVEVQEGRFGLQGIRERVRLLGGSVSIETGVNQGTHIRVTLPLVERAPEIGVWEDEEDESQTDAGK